MKVSRWKVLSIAGALVLGYAVTSPAAQIKVSDDTFADLGYWMKVRYNNFDDRAKGDYGTLSKPDYSRNVFDVVDARFNIEGQVNKFVQFYGEVVTSGAYSSGVYDAVGLSRDTTAKLSEGGVNLVFVPELQLRLGKIRIPFTRKQQEARYSQIVQSDWFYERNVHNLFGYWGNGLLRCMDGGAVLHGEIAKGMFRYDVGVFNQASDDEPLNSVAWSARIEFTPTMLGFNPETKTTGRGWLHETYLGKRGDVLTIGLGYFTQDVAVNPNDDKWNKTGRPFGGALIPGTSLDPDDDLAGTNVSILKTFKELDVDAWTIDAFLEKKIGCALIDLEAGYVNFDDSHLGYDSLGQLTKKEDSYYWYIQGQVMYDNVVGIGKPALYAFYEYGEADNFYKNPTTGKVDDYEFYRFGLGVNYYIQGNAARLTAGVDWVSYDEGAEKYLKSTIPNKKTWIGEDNITDYYIQAQIMF